MKSPPTGLQWVAVVSCCTLATMLITSPQRLPDPIRTGIEKAVDGVTVGCLWLWGHPFETQEASDWTRIDSIVGR